MPSTSKHVKRAHQHLLAARAAAGQPPSLSWAVVALADSAHQLVHAVLDCAPGLADPERHPENHTSPVAHNPGTNHVVKSRFPSIRSDYLDLYALGRGVRYSGLTLDHTGWQDALTGPYADIHAWACQQLTSAGRHAPAWQPQDTGTV